MFERGGGRGMYVAELALAVVAGGLWFSVADGLDRFLATYNPSATGAKPTDKFTSDGAGTLANTLNIASPPGIARIGASVGMAALPAIASVFVENPFIKSGLEGMAVGGGVKLFSLFWNNFLMPMFKPKDTSNTGLQQSFIARLYPAEVSASINLHTSPPTTSATGTAFGALSQPPYGVGDVGPFAIGGPGAEAAGGNFPTASEALRQAAGMSDMLPTVQNVWGTGAMSTPGEPPGIAGLGDIFGDITRTVSSFLPGLPIEHAAQAAGAVTAEPHNIFGALQRIFPHVPHHALTECARHLHPHLARMHHPAPPHMRPGAPVVAPPAPLPPHVAAGTSGVGGYGFVGATPAVAPPAPQVVPTPPIHPATTNGAPPPPPHAVPPAAPVVAVHPTTGEPVAVRHPATGAIVHPHTGAPVTPIHPSTGAPVAHPAAPTVAVPVPVPVAAPLPVAHAGWHTGPSSPGIPGPQPPRVEGTSAACACLGEPGDQFIGFIGEPGDEPLMYKGAA
jgi:hypothetical protein